MAIKDKDNRWIDSAGNAIPVKYIDPVDKNRDRLVNKLMKQAKAVSDRICNLRESAFDDIENFINETEERYDVKVRTKGGNKILTDFSNTLKIEIRVAHTIEFDERLNMAKTIIDECIKRWSEGSDDKIKLLIDQAFKVDRKGNLDKDRVLGLRQLKIKDKEWRKAMGIISDSTKVVGSKQYIKFSRKNEKGVWETVNLDIARC